VHCLLRQLIDYPLFSMVIVLTADVIDTEQETPSHCAVHDMHDRNFISGKDLSTS
jgi:hypothetical protein